MKLVVTGGAGFIGSHFVRCAVAGAYPAWAGAEVVVLDAFTYAGNPDNLAPVAGSPRYRLVVGDVADPAAVARTLDGADALVHFAAETHVDRSIADPAVFARSNVLGTQTLLDGAVAAGVGRVLVVSTDEVYGSIADGSWPETQAPSPSSPYAASKAGADLFALAYARTHGLDVRITRGSNTYGPYQFPEKLIPRFVTNLLDGEPVPLYGDGGNVRDWLHVDDHCRGIALVLDGGRPGEIYHVGGGSELSNRELTGRILRACDADWSQVQAVPDRKGHDRRYSLDFDKIRTELGYCPQVDVETGLASTIAWYREHRDWWRPLKERSRQATRA